MKLPAECRVFEIKNPLKNSPSLNDGEFFNGFLIIHEKIFTIPLMNFQ